jgi:hypothetical protein
MDLTVQVTGFVVTGGFDNKVFVWSAADGSVQHELQTPGVCICTSVPLLSRFVLMRAL